MESIFQVFFSAAPLFVQQCPTGKHSIPKPSFLTDIRRLALHPSQIRPVSFQNDKNQIRTNLLSLFRMRKIRSWSRTSGYVWWVGYGEMWTMKIYYLFEISYISLKLCLFLFFLKQLIWQYSVQIIFKNCKICRQINLIEIYKKNLYTVLNVNDDFGEMLGWFFCDRAIYL